MEFSLDALGRVIRERREAIPEMTQQRLGRAAGYGEGAGVSISRIENGFTRPSPERFAGIAAALGVTTEQLEAEAGGQGEERTTSIESPGGGDGRLRERAKRIQKELERRQALLTKLGDEFNDAHDRARDEFFMRFVEIANGVEGAPQPDQNMLNDDEVADDEAGPEVAAAFRLRVTSFGVAKALAGGTVGAAAGAGVGSAAAYGAFMAAASYGTASTGAAIASLSGAAASNAALALLGGGTLAAGGAGVAGGTLLLTGIVAAPAVLLAIGGMVWMVKRNRKQQRELAETLKRAEAEVRETAPGFEALIRLLPRATATLSYIAVHAAHALQRWQALLAPELKAWLSMPLPERQQHQKPINYEQLTSDEQERYQDFITIAASQLAVVSINVHDLIESRDTTLERLVDETNQVLAQAQAKVEELV